MHANEFGVKTKVKRVSQWPICISNTLNKFSKDGIFKQLPPCCDIDHKIKVVPRLAPPYKALHRLNNKKLENFKNQINDLIEKNYIKPN